MPKADKGLKGLGAKYGSTLRKKYSGIFRILKMKRNCPKCGSWNLRRKGKGIWACKSCGLAIAGRAYDIVPPTISPS